MKKQTSTVEFELMITRLCEFAQAESDCERTCDKLSAHNRDDSAEAFRDSATISPEFEECPAAIGGHGD